MVTKMTEERVTPTLQEARARQPPLAFSRAVPEGVSVSADGLAVSRVGSDGWRGAVVEPAVSSAERCYAEWVIEEADACCDILIGVTDLDAVPPAGQCMHDMPGSRMYHCYDSTAYPGGRDWGAAGQRKRGERVGVLVERGSVWVYVDGARLGPGPMATDLPQRVRAARARSKRTRAHAPQGMSAGAADGVRDSTRPRHPGRARLPPPLSCARYPPPPSSSIADLFRPPPLPPSPLTSPPLLPQVRFAVELCNPGSRLRLVPGAAPPGA